jgi:hypothetical protein
MSDAGDLWVIRFEATIVAMEKDLSLSKGFG